MGGVLGRAWRVAGGPPWAGWRGRGGPRLVERGRVASGPP